MTLPASGPISLNNVNVELGLSGTTSINMNQSSVRTLFGKPSGAISMSDGYGKANQFAFTISSNQTNANLRTLAVNAGWNQSTKVVATINSGVYVSSNSTGTAGLTINGSFPNGVELINNGVIAGMGGAGGKGRSWYNPYTPDTYNGTNGSSGGLALTASVPISITNNNIIAGGGGGGGGGGNGFGRISSTNRYCGGGSGGGGRTGATNSVGGIASAQGPGDFGGPFYIGSAGGTGTASAPGSGGPGGSYSTASGGAGGAGGAWGSSGSNGVISRSQPTIGGAAGAAVTGNGNITWVATGTRYGAIS